MTFANRDAVFQPQEAVTSALETMGQRLEENESGESVGFSFDLPELRDYLRPLYPGEFGVICGLSRNGKSFLLKKGAYLKTMEIYDEGPSNKCVIVMTWEESAEILAMNWLATLSGISSTKMLRGNISRQEFDRINTIAVKVSQYPIYIIGPSINRGKDGVRRKPDLSMKGVESALEWIMNKQKKDPQLIIGDYLQRVPGNHQKREIHIMQTVDWFKDLGFWSGAPVLMGSQAKQIIEDRKYPQPRLYDSEWSANAAQSADMFLGSWMPKTTFRAGETIDSYAGYHNIEVTPTLMMLGVNKQKGDMDGFVFPLELQPDLLKWRVATCYYGSDLATAKNRMQPRKAEFL